MPYYPYFLHGIFPIFFKKIIPTFFMEGHLKAWIKVTQNISS